MVGLGGLEPPTPSLSGTYSNQLSYRPMIRKVSKKYKRKRRKNRSNKRPEFLKKSLKGGDPAAGSPTATLLRLHPSHQPHRGERSPEG